MDNRLYPLRRLVFILIDTIEFVTHRLQVITVRQTITFRDWLDRLKDGAAARRIVQRLARIEIGNFGDVKFFDGIGELRIDAGPGYRVYFVRKGLVVVVILCGGDKSSQRRDIMKAMEMAKEV